MDFTVNTMTASKMSRLKNNRKFVLFFILSLMFFLTINAKAGTGGFNEWRLKTGHVMSRGLILTEQGFPIYTQYLSDGSLGSDIAVLDASLSGSTVISGDAYRASAAHYTDFITQYGDTLARGAQILTAEDYQSKKFTTIDGDAVADSAKARLLSSRIKSVLVRSSQQLLIPQSDPALLQSVINLNAIDSSVVNNSNIVSVLIDKNGNVIHASSNNIGFKAGFFKGEENSLTPEQSDDVYAPVIGVGVEVPAPYLGGKTATDQNGKFGVSYMLPPCPGFQFEYRTPVTATLSFGFFNPKGDYRSVIYPQTMPGWDFCSGLSNAPSGLSLVELMDKVNVMAIEATMSYPVVDYGFKVDTAMLLGKGYLSNLSATGEYAPLPISTTQYSYNAPNLANRAYQQFDFDGDGTFDTAVLGNIAKVTDANGDEVSTFTQSDSGSLQGIYLSSGSQNPNSTDEALKQPDFVRLGDKAPDFQHQGLLKSISIEDFADTDILVFRESNGMLITSKQGMKPEETIAINSGGVGDDNLINFSMMLRGPSSSVWDYLGHGFHSSYGLRGGYDFSAVQSDANINPALHQRKADHLRPFESLRVVAINRKTGYIGTTRTTYGTFMGVGEGVVNMTAVMNMRPPNLKIIAEREYIVDKGLSKGDEKKYLIGYEGAALSSDRIIKITTQWFDHDGSPLPEGLGDYGYTGRLAKIVGVNTVGQAGSALANFSLKTPLAPQQDLLLLFCRVGRTHYCYLSQRLFLHR